MDLIHVINQLDRTPAFVLDEKCLINNLETLAYIKEQSACQVLYSIKALPLEPVLKLAMSYLDGLSVSSLFEARLAKEVLADFGKLHITTPGLRDYEFQELTEICTHISFNSINQYQRMPKNQSEHCSFGLRINPKLSFADDPRYDPCRLHSKLGIDIDTLDKIPEGIEGLHFHTVFSNTDYFPLIKTVDLLKKKMASSFAQLKWMNFGGGYLYSEIENHEIFIDLVTEIQQEFGIQVYIEPGKAIVGNAGYLVTTVIDRFSSDGKQIAVLDTSVNHNPEVFEYQKSPDLLETDVDGRFSCILVGSSCLAGDVFGDYQFQKLPEIGERLVFSNLGAYSLTKANQFNGYNLPDIFFLDKQQVLTQLRQNTYADYQTQWKNINS